MSSNSQNENKQNQTNYWFLFFIISVAWTSLITAWPVMVTTGILHTYWNSIPAFSLKEVWIAMISIAVTVRLVRYS